MVTVAEAFFYEHAGYSYDPRTQTPEEGRHAAAKRLAHVEEAGREAGLSFEWMVDNSDDSSSFSEETPPWRLWGCICHDNKGAPGAALWGIDFGRDGTPWSNTCYRRVVEAELASEQLSDQ